MAPENREKYAKYAPVIENFTKMMMGMKNHKKLIKPAERENIQVFEQLTKKGTPEEKTMDKKFT